MGKKAKEYKSGDFIFAKVKGYPAWPARVQKLVGKKYFVYFYGTGEIAHLPPNQVFDYAENKDKFLTKTVKRKDFNDGVRQIEHDFANKVPLEDIIGLPAEDDTTLANNAINDSTNQTFDDSIADTTADATIASEANTTLNETGDIDDASNLIIDEGKKGRKSKADASKTPKPAEKEAAAKTPAKEARTPRGRPKKEDLKKEDSKDKEESGEEKKDEEEIVSRSGRKIRPKRFVDEHTEENATLPSPAAKKRRGGSPALEKEKSESKEKPDDKTTKQFNTVSQSELEDLKEPFSSDDAEKKNILIAYLPGGQYVGIKLFQSRPSSFKNEAARLQWDKASASNSIKLKLQLEKGHITPQSVSGQLEMDLNLTDEEKSTLDKEREIEEKKSRVQFLKTEMKLIELDAKIKSCLSLEKANTDTCLKLLDELLELEVKPLMLLKHPTCLETVKRMRAYVGNTPSWDLSEADALQFSKQAHSIRKQADTLYKNMKELFSTPEGLSFWEFFSERVLLFKKTTAKLNADELLELVHEPIEMSQPSSHTMKSSIEAANAREPPPPEDEDIESTKKSTPVKAKKSAENTSKPTPKRQSSRSKITDDKEKESIKQSEEMESNKKEEKNKKDDKETSQKDLKDSDKKDDKDSGKKELRESGKKDDKNKKDDKESSRKEEKESSKVSEKEPSKKDDKESTKKDDKASNKKDEKDSNKKDDKVSSKKDDKDDKDPKKTQSKESKKDEKDKKSEDKESNKKSDEKTHKKSSSKESSRKSDAKESKKKDDKESKKTTSEKDSENKDKSDSNEKSDTSKEVNDKDDETIKDNDIGASKETQGEKEDEPMEVNNVEENDSDSSKKNLSEKTSKESNDAKSDCDKAEDREGSNKRTKENSDDKIDDEPRAKRSRDSKKSEPPVARSPAKRKSKS